MTVTVVLKLHVIPNYATISELKLSLNVLIIHCNSISLIDLQEKKPFRNSLQPFRCESFITEKAFYYITLKN